MVTFIRLGDFHVHYQYEWRLQFYVFPIVEWSSLDGSTGVAYQSTESCDTVNKFDPDKCRMLMYGTYRWRGIWESHIYFPDGEELWGYEFESVSKLFTEQIRPWAEAFIKEKEPDIKE